MAERRMFTKKITDSDSFISLSSSAQALYLHLNQGADDDGFNNQVQIAMLKAHASTDDLTALLGRGFLYQFEGGVVVVKHWRMHNTLRKDRYNPTSYQDEFSLLGIKDNGSYTLVAKRLPDGCQTVATDKYSIGEVSINKYICPSDPENSGSNEPVEGQNDPTFDLNDLGQTGSNRPKRGQKQGQNKLFAEFWLAYPRKVKKQTALKAWVKLRVDDELFAEIMDGLGKWKTCKQWNKDGGEFIPYPATFLNAMQWQDAPEPVEDDGYAGFDADTKARLIETEKRLRKEGLL